MEESSLKDITLQEWVMDKCQHWRDHYEQNYKLRHDEYYRLWRGQWAKEDSMRDSERSRIITPALQQAVESSVAEVEEATFGRGRWFDIKDDYQDKDNQDIEFMKNQLYEDMQFARMRSSISEVLLNAAVFGTGVGELYLQEEKERTPSTQPTEQEGLSAVGVVERDRFVVKMRPIMPKHFLIDPLATSIEDALGCAIDQYVSQHQVQLDIDSGIYMDKEVTTEPKDTNLEPDAELSYTEDEGVRLTRYYGLVPRHLYEEAIKSGDIDEVEEELMQLSDETEEKSNSSFVEVIVVIANEEVLLKVETNPFMMEDRPIVAFSWDTVPSLFWGRGICEKGFNAQKALDTEMRARIDALALTVHPMMAVDASRMPRGSKFEIRPGKTLLTNGNPSEILQPFKFGSIDQVTFAQGSQLQEMVQQATGAVDTVSFAGAMQGDGTAAGISMSMGAIIKRHKRTLLNFQECFLIPLITKSAHRYMQFEPTLYKAQDYKFVAAGTLGLIAREYEVSQLVQLLQTMPSESPLYSILIESIIDNMNLSSRESLLEAIKKSREPNPQQQEIEQAKLKGEFEMQQAQISAFASQAQESSARAKKLSMEAEAIPLELEIDKIAATTKNLHAGSGDDREFERRMRIADLRIKERDLDIKEKSVDNQSKSMLTKEKSNPAEDELLKRLTNGS